MFEKNEKLLRYRTFIDAIYYAVKLKGMVTDNDLKVIEWFMRKTKIQEPVFIQQPIQQPSVFEQPIIPTKQKKSLFKKLTKQDDVTGDKIDFL